MRSSCGRPTRNDLRIVAALSVCLVFVLGGGSGGATDEVVDTLQARYDSVKDLHAEFEQTSFVASLGSEEVSKGTVVVQRPGRMRWEYTDPERRVIVLDHDTLRIYVPGDRQLQIASLASGTVSPTALSFLMGEGRLREIFDATRITESERPEIGLKLRAKEDAGFDFLEFWLDPESHQLRESVLVDLFGNRTQVRFRAIRENAGVEEKVFSIRVPDDTEVLDLR